MTHMRLDLIERQADVIAAFIKHFDGKIVYQPGTRHRKSLWLRRDKDDAWRQVTVQRVAEDVHNWLCDRLDSPFAPTDARTIRTLQSKDFRDMLMLALRKSPRTSVQNLGALDN